MLNLVQYLLVLIFLAPITSHCVYFSFDFSEHFVFAVEILEEIETESGK